MPMTQAEREAWGRACNSILYACAGKDGFETRTMAEQVIRRMLRSRTKKRKDAGIGAYRCDYCRKWHIGAKT